MNSLRIICGENSCCCCWVGTYRVLRYLMPDKINTLILEVGFVFLYSRGLSGMSNGGSHSNQRYHFATQSALLFALFLDNYEIGKLTDCVTDISEQFFGGRRSVVYNAELKLITRLLYYWTSLFSFGRTPGQSFCDFFMIRAREEDMTNLTDTSNITSETNKRTVVSHLQRWDYVQLSLLYSVLPYLVQRQETILDGLSELWHILTAPEQESATGTGITTVQTPTPSTMRNEISSSSSGGNSNHGHDSMEVSNNTTTTTTTTSSDGSDNDTNNSEEERNAVNASTNTNTNINRNSFVAVLSRAFASSLQTLFRRRQSFPNSGTGGIGNGIDSGNNNSSNGNNTGRRRSNGGGSLENLVQFGEDIHRLLFLLTGRYLEFALRVLQVRLITTSHPRFQASLKSLSWLVGFRISLLLFYSVRVLLSDLDRELRINDEDAESSASDTADNTGTTGSSSVSRKSNGEEHSTGSSSSSSSSNVSSSSSSGGSSSSSAKCALCIDYINHPSAAPCGHVFCWDCIVGYATSSSSSNSSANGAAAGPLVKCPICRGEFPPQKIRYLFQYCSN